MALKLLSALLKGNWLIDKKFAESQLPLIAAILSGTNANFEARPKAYEDDDAMREAPKPLMAVFMSENGPVGSRYSSYDQAPAGSIAVIPIIGPIMKYGGDCGEPGSIHMTGWVKEAKASKNIIGAIFKVDSPGGQVDGTASLADEIKNFGKPTAGFVDDGMAASAAMWIISNCDVTYASQVTDEVGSIGVFTTLYDYTEWMEMKGIKLHQIYAPQSTEKNQDYIKALGGNYNPIKDDLKFICDQFISVIKTNRAGKLNLSAGDPFKGDMYFADQAIAIGLIDGIKSFDQVAEEIASGNIKNTNNKSANSTSTNMFDKNFKKVSALKGKAVADITAEELQAANAELIVEGITGVTLGPDTSARLAELEGQLTAATEKNTTLEGKITSLEAEVGALGKQPGEKPTEAAKPKEEIGADAKTGTKFEDYDHNKKALSQLDGL